MHVPRVVPWAAEKVLRQVPAAVLYAAGDAVGGSYGGDMVADHFGGLSEAKNALGYLNDREITRLHPGDPRLLAALGLSVFDLAGIAEGKGRAARREDFQTRYTLSFLSVYAGALLIAMDETVRLSPWRGPEDVAALYDNARDRLLGDRRRAPVTTLGQMERQAAIQRLAGHLREEVDVARVSSREGQEPYEDAVKRIFDSLSKAAQVQVTSEPKTAPAASWRVDAAYDLGAGAIDMFGALSGALGRDPQRVLEAFRHFGGAGTILGVEAQLIRDLRAGMHTYATEIINGDHYTPVTPQTIAVAIGRLRSLAMTRAGNEFEEGRNQLVKAVGDPDRAEQVLDVEWLLRRLMTAKFWADRKGLSKSQKQAINVRNIIAARAARPGRRQGAV